MLALHAAFGAMVMHRRVPHCADTRIAHCSSCQRAPGSVAVWALTPTCMAAGMLLQAPCKHSNKSAPGGAGAHEHCPAFHVGAGSVNC